tara:strand:- start:2 stop:652 length:651 start_codon:yes stop_codon:yes gene_type:complete
MISNNLKKRIITSIFLSIVILVMFYYKPVLALMLLIIGNFCVIEFSYILNGIYKNNFYKTLVNIIFIIFIFSFCLLFFFLSNFFQTKIILFSFLICCAASDIGGYIFGKTFKGPKLTIISPNKTIAGAIGSIILSSIVFIGIFYYFFDNINLKFFIIAVFTSIGCQIGDIFFSYLKRKAKIKDTGNFLPGHGGFLDRVDGILLGVPIGFVTLTLLF